MSNQSFLVPLLSATLGALAAGLLRILLDRYDRARHRQSVLKAFAAEVGILCWIIRHHYHPDRWRLLAHRVEGGEEARLVLDLSQNHFVIFENLAREIGILRREESVTIIEFYKILMIAIESVGLKSLYSTNPQNMRFTAGIIEVGLRLGDRIVELPKDGLLRPVLHQPVDWSARLKEALDEPTASDALSNDD